MQLLKTLPLLIGLFLLLCSQCAGKGIVSSHVRTGLGARWSYATSKNTLMGFHIDYGYYLYNDYKEDRIQNGTWLDPNITMNQVRGTSCVPQGGQDIKKSGAWMTAQIGIEQIETSNIGEFETDLNAELLFRAPCNPPTYSSVLRVCLLDEPRPIEDSDRNDTSTCYTFSVFVAEHASARRRLLQAAPYKYIEVAVGTSTFIDGLMVYEALSESLSDPESKLKNQYQMDQLVGAEIVQDTTPMPTALPISTPTPTALPTSTPTPTKVVIDPTNPPTIRSTSSPPTGSPTAVPTYQPPGSPSPKSGSDDPDYMVIIIVALLVVIVILIVVGLVCCKKVLNKQRDQEEAPPTDVMPTVGYAAPVIPPLEQLPEGSLGSVGSS